MTERHLRCGADGCHFCCCCSSKYDRLGCLLRHVVWHIQNWFTNPRPPRNTILLLDELEEWEDKQNVTSSSCDEAKLKDRENFGRSIKSPLENFNDSNQKLLAEVPDKVPKGAHDPEKVETSKTEPKTAHGSNNPSKDLDPSENVQGNDNPSQQSNNLKTKKLPLHEGMPPAQVPLAMVAGNLHQFTWYRTSKEKNNKWIINIRIDTGLVAYTRIITDSTRIFDRGRLSGLDPMSLLVSTAPSAGEGR